MFQFVFCVICVTIFLITNILLIVPSCKNYNKIIYIFSSLSNLYICESNFVYITKIITNFFFIHHRSTHASLVNEKIKKKRKTSCHTLFLTKISNMTKINRNGNEKKKKKKSITYPSLFHHIIRDFFVCCCGCSMWPPIIIIFIIFDSIISVRHHTIS